MIGRLSVLGVRGPVTSFINAVAGDPTRVALYLNQGGTALAREYYLGDSARFADIRSKSPVPGVHVNGNQTLGENIADLGGLAIAYKAYRISFAGKTVPVIDGCTGDQRFFMGFAQAWRAKARDEYLRRQVLTGAHAWSNSARTARSAISLGSTRHLREARRQALSSA